MCICGCVSVYYLFFSFFILTLKISLNDRIMKVEIEIKIKIKIKIKIEIEIEVEITIEIKIKIKMYIPYLVMYVILLHLPSDTVCTYLIQSYHTLFTHSPSYLIFSHLIPYIRAGLLTPKIGRYQGTDSGVLQFPFGSLTIWKKW